MRLARLLASNSDITKVFNIKHRHLASLALFIYEYGLMLNESLALKMALLSCPAIPGKNVKSLLDDILRITSPESVADKSDKMLDENMPALMKELENTIVTFDRKSVQRALLSDNNSKLSI